MSIDRLMDSILQKRNPTVLGLDPRMEHIPPELLARHLGEKGKSLEAVAAAAEDMCLALLDALADIVPAVKLQSACFEQFGREGMAVMERLIRTAKEQGYYVIADAKRGDIGSASTAYAAAWLGRITIDGEALPVFDADGLTVNPYLGSDNLTPFLEDCKRYDKMVFVLCRTSNRSSFEVQELMTGDRPLYRVIAEQIERAGAGLVGKYGYSSAAAVVGATRPRHLRELRSLHPSLFFLVPGYGAQGGKPEDVAYAFDRYGRGAIVNNSRGICCAYQQNGGNIKDAARTAAIDMRAALSAEIRMV